MSRLRGWRGELAAVAWPLLTYQFMVLLSLGTFFATILTLYGFDGSKDALALTGIAVGTLCGGLFGQVMSLLRVRSTWMALFNTGLFIFSIWLATQGPQLEMFIGDAAFILVFTLMIGSIMSSGGFWSLRTNRGLAATWAPMVLFTSSILAYSEKTGADDTWRAGDKWAIWDGISLLILGSAVFLLLVYLLGRERHRVHRWRTAPVATELVDTGPEPLRPLRGCGTWLLLGGLIVFLTASSALVAPYLWRTGDRGGEETTDQEDDPEDEPDETDPMDGEALQEALRHVQRGISILCTLLTLLVLALAALFVFGPPLRRQLLLTHLRDPYWPVPPSRQAYLHWRLTEIALGDAGIHREPGETALDVARRGLEALPDVHLEALETAAEIADRVAYGYGLEPTDVDTARRAAEMTYQAIWETLSELERLKATYRLL